MRKIAVQTAAVLTKEAVIHSIGKGRMLGGRYRDAKGREFIGQAVSNVGSDLSAAGFRGYSRIDEYDLKKLGVEVVDAEGQRGGGRWGGRFVPCIVKEWK